MDQAPRMAFSHIGLNVIDMAAMVEWYTDVLGFLVTDRARIRDADVVFLSRSPDAHHQIVLVPGRMPGSRSTVNQISFRVISLAELLRLYTQRVALGLQASSHQPTCVNPKKRSNTSLKPGSRVAFFKIYSTIPTEIILGEDDKHLCLRLLYIPMWPWTRRRKVEHQVP